MSDQATLPAGSARSATAPWRIHFGLTTRCNRVCPWCDVDARQSGATFLSEAAYTAAFPAEGAFEVHLTGGEPSMHPQLDHFIQLARRNPRCRRVVLHTNGVVFPRTRIGQRTWLFPVGTPCSIQLSINHYLLRRDKSLLALASSLADHLQGFLQQNEGALVLEVVLERGAERENQEVMDLVRDSGLGPWAVRHGVYALGRAEEQAEEPTPTYPEEVVFVAPDGACFGNDYAAYCAHTAALP